MIRDKSMNFSVLLVVFVAYCSSSRFCRAQGNGNGSGNPCGTYGLCGAFGICNSQVSPVCSCLQGFNPQAKNEWDSGNWTNGCVRRVPLNCELGNGTVNGGREDGFLKLKMMKISGYSERWSGQENQCQDRCLRNCSCIAYAFDAGIGCMGWSATLMDTQKFPTGSGSDLYIRLASSELGSKKNNTRTVIIVVVVGIVIASCGAYLCWKWMAKRRGKNGGMPPNAGISGSIDSSQQDTPNQANLEDLPLFKYEILANATNLFSEINKLGKGGFGSVYWGELANGREIAVKRLSKASVQGMQEFMNEVVLISKLQHRNLVTLLGCCVENKETMLVYEYMPNKSLDFFLFDRSQDVLDWKRRFNIIEGICRGLLYLHRDSRLKIIHRDLKPSNILLDNHWNPKISDFGMARIYGVKQDHVSTVRVVGTYGYMAPEYAMDGRFSEKSDVYSFGVMMLEIATGRRNSSYSYTHQEGSLNLVGHVWDLWKEGKTRALIDARISSSCNQSEVVRCMHIGLLCVQGSPIDRPSVSSILSMLRSETIVLPAPHHSAFAPRTSRYDTGTSSSQPSQNSSSSLNNVTLTMMDGR